MLQSLRKRRERDEGGFTLIELMVVVLIIAILLAIAIPTFLGARERAQDRAAQSNLRNAMTAEKVYFTDNQAYTTDSGNGPIKTIEPSLTFGATPAVNTIAIVTAQTTVANDTVVLGTKSASGKCFYLKDIATGATAGTTYGVQTAATCPAPAVGLATLDKW